MFKLVCPDCGHTEYFLRPTLKHSEYMQAAIDKKIFPCAKCSKRNLKYHGIKFKFMDKLLKKFPGKKVIRTNKTEQELLKMEGEWVKTTDPGDPEWKYRE